MTALDVQQLLDRAVALDGRPLPGVRMTEKQFEAVRDEDVRAEWVDGEVIVMSPANIEHIDLNGWLWQVVGGFVQHHELGRVFGIEAQVRLPKRRARRNPDLLFISKSRNQLIKPTYIDGAPDLIMEIVSPDSESRDWREKYFDYEAGGVREYWIIDPPSKRVEAYTLGGRAGMSKYGRTDAKSGPVKSKVLRGFYLRPEWLWKSPLPKVSLILKELGVR